MKEQRKNKRLDLEVSIQLERLDEKGSATVKSVPVEVTDISKSGIGFTASEILSSGSYYDTRIQIWTKEVVDAVVEIVRCDKKETGELHYGGVFIGMSDIDALKIDIYDMFLDE